MDWKLGGLTAALVLFCAGCVTAPKAPASRAEWEAIHTRSFAASPEQVSEAADRVLRLADDEFKIDYPPGQIVATRPWVIYAVIAFTQGVDYWKLDLKEQPDGSTRATLQLSRAQGTVGPMMTYGGDVGVASMGSLPGQPVSFPAPYELFWQRVEHQLGMRDTWPTCDAFIETLERSGKHGVDMLCSVNTDDRSPN